MKKSRALPYFFTVYFQVASLSCIVVNFIYVMPNHSNNKVFYTVMERHYNNKVLKSIFLFVKPLNTGLSVIQE